MIETGLARLRADAGRALFTRVAGPKGMSTSRRIHETPDPRWFPPDSEIRRVHGDAAMFVGGLRALLLQSLHPLAMAAVAAHSGFKGDPWGRLQRTSTFLATTTFGTVADAQAAVARVRAVHRPVRGTAPDGRSYAASDPHLLRWVHVAEVDSFLRAYQRYGTAALDPAGQDAYVAQTARVATALGVDDPPRTVAALSAQLTAFRPELAGTPAAREAARFIVMGTPVPVALRAPYALLAASAVGLLPRWARWPLRLPYLPLTEATVVRMAGETAVRGIRFVMAPPPAQPH